MTSALLVSVVTTTYEPDLDRGVQVVGSIYPASGKGRSYRNVVLVCGSVARPRSYEVEPGRYVVTATMPSGQQLVEEVEVGDGEQAEVRLKASGSPHESHTWQFLLGNVEPGSKYHDKSTVPVPRSRGSRTSLDALSPSNVAANVTWIPDSTTKSWSVDWLNFVATRDGRESERLAELVADRVAPVRLPVPAVADDISRLYRFDRDGPVVGAAGDAYPGARQFLLVELGSDLHLATLPSPWGFAQVEVLVNRRQSPTGSPIAVTVRDPAVGAGLGYMAEGELTKAATLFTDPERMLYEKMQNPLAAAAGGYVMVGTDLTDTSTHWDPWLDNLRNWFGWMSDGSVLWAVRRLRSARNDDDIKQARLALVEAYDRGIPFFTLGLSWLVDALGEFPEDDDCVRRWRELRRLCWRVDMREPFVIVRMDGDGP
jgi:hypothetical protein